MSHLQLHPHPHPRYVILSLTTRLGTSPPRPHPISSAPRRLYPRRALRHRVHRDLGASFLRPGPAQAVQPNSRIPVYDRHPRFATFAFATGRPLRESGLGTVNASINGSAAPLNPYRKSRQGRPRTEYWERGGSYERVRGFLCRKGLFTDV
jgi:hypothetical protein